MYVYYGYLVVFYVDFGKEKFFFVKVILFEFDVFCFGDWMF